MDREVEWSREARTVLRQVFTYLWDNYGEDYARRYLAKVFRITDSLAQHPSKGRPVQGSRIQRRWKLDDHYYIVYQIKGSGIRILSMLSYKLGE